MYDLYGFTRNYKYEATEKNTDIDAWISDTIELMHPLEEPVTPVETFEITSAVSGPIGRNTFLVPCSKQTAGLQRRINRFGRIYTCGRPLSIDTRRVICGLYHSGSKPCEIASILDVTHGCVSKIVKRYQMTGQVEARKIGGSNPRKSLPTVVNAIIKYKTDQPMLRTWEVRDRLIADSHCDWTTLPTLSSINRIIREHLGRFYSKRIKQASPTMDTSYRNVNNYNSNRSRLSSASEPSTDGFCTPSPCSVLDEFFCSPQSINNNADWL